MLIMTALVTQDTLHRLIAVKRSKIISALFRIVMIKNAEILATALAVPTALEWPIIVLNEANVITRGGLLLQIWSLETSNINH